MHDSIPENIIQCTFDFDALSDQSVDDVILHINSVSPQKKKFCIDCEQWLPVTTEYFHQMNRRGKNEFRLPCRSCRNKQRRTVSMCQTCRILLRETAHLCKECHDRKVQWIAEHGNSRKGSRELLREQVFTAYGGACVQCGGANPAFLSIDHVNNDGGDHRRTNAGRGHRLYTWLRNNSFPQHEFQLLCHNCNWFKNISNKPDLAQSDAAKNTRIWNAKLRNEVLDAYGNQCVCCSEARPEVLTIDHVNNDGAEHRRLIPSGSPLYNWLRKNNFPKDGFQLLCRNCNFAKQGYGVCLHQNAP